MNLQQLYYFKELVEERQFLKAARNLNISQPSLSNSLKSLEQELGCQLIERNNGCIFLTKYGEIFYQTAVSSIKSIENGKKQIEREKMLDNSVINVASIPTGLSSYLLPKIADYQNKFSPKTQFIYYDAVTSEICSGIRSGKYDFGLCSKDNKYPDLSFIPLYSEPLVLITQKDHHLAEKKNVSPKDLKDSTILTYTGHSSLGKKIRKLLLKRNKKLKILNIANDDVSLASAVISNNQIAVGVKSVFLEHFNISKISLTLPKDARTVYLVYNPRRKKNQKVVSIINYLKIQK